jgi:hypothetical protein
MKDTPWLNSSARVRFGGLLLGILIVVWLSIEESSTLGVVLLAGLVCTRIALWLLQRTRMDGKHLIFWPIIIGSGAGLLLAPLAVLLMALKSGLHGHGAPDFNPGQLQAVFSRMPFYILAGFLIGTGGGLLRYAFRFPSNEE